MRKPAAVATPSAGTLGALLAGSLVAIGAAAWWRSRVGEAALEERTSSRLRPRHIQPDASDIKVAPLP
jgi:NAD(P)H-hydrate repair Nnr-like enzyme with NAD(P)H-hydrate dehydratase domain